MADSVAKPRLPARLVCRYPTYAIMAALSTIYLVLSVAFYLILLFLYRNFPHLFIHFRSSPSFFQRLSPSLGVVSFAEQLVPFQSHLCCDLPLLPLSRHILFRRAPYVGIPFDCDTLMHLRLF